MKNEKGFTLIEIVISLAIISISLVVLVAALNRTIATSHENTVLTSAVMLGGEQMHLAMNADFPDIGTSEWKTDVRYPDYRFREAVSPTPLPEVMRVTVEVEHRSKKAFELQGYVIKGAFK
jgi:prepilin-type N-terminal cleavage/methylation domain-containing protein